MRHIYSPNPRNREKDIASAMNLAERSGVAFKYHAHYEYTVYGPYGSSAMVRVPCNENCVISYPSPSSSPTATSGT